MTAEYTPRVQTLRNELVRIVPRTPNNRDTQALMHALPTRELVLAYMTWRMRLVPAKPRKVEVWAAGVPPLVFLATRYRLRDFLAKVEQGKDLRPHLLTSSIEGDTSSSRARGLIRERISTKSWFGPVCTTST